MAEALDYGVCRLSIVPVRIGPGDGVAQSTQLLFGDHYEVRGTSDDRRWLYILILTDHCEGWIDAYHHHSITKAYLDQISNADFKITTDLTASLLYKKSPLMIVIGSIVPIATSELFKMEEQLAFNGETKSLAQRRDFEFLRVIAQKYINSPAVAGGKSPFGIDAGALVQIVFRICGYSLMRHASQQADQGKKIKSIQEAKPGDLAFFANDEGHIIHVGILLEEDKVIHAAGQVRIDTLDDEGIRHSETKQLSHRLHSLRRIL